MKLVTFTLLPSEARVIRDALQTLFGMTGLARLRYWSNDARAKACASRRARTPIEESGATYGCSSRR